MMMEIEKDFGVEFEKFLKENYHEFKCLNYYLMIGDSYHGPYVALNDDMAARMAFHKWRVVTRLDEGEFTIVCESSLETHDYYGRIDDSIQIPLDRSGKLMTLKRAIIEPVIIDSMGKLDITI